MSLVSLNAAMLLALLDHERRVLDGAGNDEPIGILRADEPMRTPVVRTANADRIERDSTAIWTGRKRPRSR